MIPVGKNPTKKAKSPLHTKNLYKNYNYYSWRFDMLKIDLNKNKLLAIIIGLLYIVLSFTGCSSPLAIEEETYAYLESIDLNKDYEWYKTQMNTGPASYCNCGPACVSMSVKYIQNKNASVTSIRNLNYNNGSWWYTNDIKKALNKYDINYTVKSLKSKEQLMDSLSKGHLILACLDMSFLTEETGNSESKYNRFYENVTGHFIILKGYLKGQEWFLTYDPNNWDNDYYSNKTPKGKDRLYNINEVYNSMSIWWDYYFELL